MNAERGAVFVTVTAVVLVSLLSGPLVPGVDLARSGEFPSELHTAFGSDTGSISVERQLAFDAGALPTRASLEGENDDYATAVEDVTVDVTTGDRSARVAYRLRIPALNHTTRATETVPAENSATVDLSLPRSVVPGERVTESSYEGTVVVTITQGDRTFEVARESVTVEVSG